MSSQPNRTLKASTSSPLNPTDPTRLLFTEASNGWPQFRGTYRNGTGTGLPRQRLKVELKWEYPLPGDGLAGIAATDEMVVVASRDINDRQDIFLILDPADGGLIFRHQYPAVGKLDYGNSPRATPVIGSELVYVLGAFGHLSVIDPAEGKIVWQTHLVEELDGSLPTWGYCSSPLLVGDRLIVQPASEHCSIIALDAKSGKALWKGSSPQPAGYASPILIPTSVADESVLSCDQSGLAAWSLHDGRLQWRLPPGDPGEFMVPSPLLIDRDIFWIGEYNGLRQYRMQAPNQSPSQTLLQTPELLNQNRDIANEISSPQKIGRYILVLDNELMLLDPENGLRVIDQLGHKSLDNYTSIIIQDDRGLAVCTDGWLLLLGLESDKLQLLDSHQPHTNSSPIYSCPALTDRLLFIRKPRSIACYQLK